ncbi:MAG: hypothetical protein ABIO60_00030 [Aquaticitalea sp.]
MHHDDIEKSPIRSMFWKDEILQLLYWMDGEGMGTSTGVKLMLPFLKSSEQNLQYHLERLSVDGFLISDSSSENPFYNLSELGKKEGGKLFAEAFQGLQKAGHGECGPDCEYCYGTDGVKMDNCVHNCASH